MGREVKLVVPDLGDFSDVEVIEILVAAGDHVDVEASLVTLETDKATMDIPASHAGTVLSVNVAVGDKLNSGDVVAIIEATAEESIEKTVIIGPEEQAAILVSAEAAASAADGSGETAPLPAIQSAKAPATIAAPGTSTGDPLPETTHFAELVVIGAGPGGYTAAFRAADLGLDVILVERSPVLGGVCLNVGCIPSKALLHAAKVIDEAAAMAEHGVTFAAPKIDALALRGWKDKVVSRLTGGLAQLAQQRKVKVVHGTATFSSANQLELDNGDTIGFNKCIIAAGSEPAMLPGLPKDARIIDSTGALELDPLPKRLLVVGGGIIGLEMACIYSALGSSVVVVELTDSLMPGTDPDLVRPFCKIVEKRYEKILLGTKVAGIQATSGGLDVLLEGKDGNFAETFDKVLISIGRRANGDKLNAQKAGVIVGERGVIPVDKRMQTNVKHIFAIGDLAGGPMLAHKATHEAKVAAEVAAGEKSAFDARSIPSVAYTDPEIAYVGLTETEAKQNGINYEKAAFPWAASGRALSLGRDEGFTKLLFDKESGRLLGGGIVGPNAGDLIAEVGLAVEMGADATDISLTIHPHPTLSETIAFAAEAFDGTLTDLYIPRKKA
ncbi:MAG: dihydrolipoyl dehydrogenase [Proteobacteria bacterium]|nr:dihydrolipoyl dehydrogenase [Pseudomonadota bacterium]MDA0992934.1 dihydrolipoyl dehydrogenase [Pseudomonadota bacterium]